jgi:hypothetical protein
MHGAPGAEPRLCRGVLRSESGLHAVNPASLRNEGRTEDGVARMPDGGEGGTPKMPWPEAFAAPKPVTRPRSDRPHRCR